MRCGISTACFYPETTLRSLQRVIEAGAQVSELFLNTFSELEAGYVAALCEEVARSGIDVVSVHPFSSSMEGFFFATPYEGRLQDGLDLYRRYFEVCQKLGAPRLVFHGDHRLNPAGFSDEQYAESFVRLARLGREYGVTLCHENVSYCRLGLPQRVREVRRLLGEYAAFVLDTKQVHRAGAQLEDMLDAMDGAIQHVHLSDHTAEEACVPPGEGELDLPALLARLAAMGYRGDLMVEVYRENFADTPQLLRGVDCVNRTLVQQNLA